MLLSASMLQLTSAVLQVVSVEFTLDRGKSYRQHVLMLGRQELGERCVIFSLWGEGGEKGLLGQNSSVANKRIKEKHGHRLSQLSYLDTSSQHLIQDVSPLFHDADVV